MCVVNELIEFEKNVYLFFEEIVEFVDLYWVFVDMIGMNTRVGCVVAVCSEGDNSVDGAGMVFVVVCVCGIDVGIELKVLIFGVMYIGLWCVL